MTRAKAKHTGQAKRKAERAARGGKEDMPARRNWSGFWIGVGIFAVALLVRLVYLVDLSDSPTYDIPIVDSRTYDELARSVAFGEGMKRDFFWQPFFYPYFLSIVYRFNDASVAGTRILQVLLGAVTCMLTYILGKRILDRRTGVLAGLFTALCGPLIFFEAELVASGWAAFWSVILLLLFVHAGVKRPIWLSTLLCFLLGVAGILCIITRPTFLPFFFWGCAWLATTMLRGEDGWLRTTCGALALAAGALPIAISVGSICSTIMNTAQLHILPASGGINFYVGNNPDTRGSISLRPGKEWDELAQLPAQHGIHDPWGQQKFFYKKTREYIFSQPLDFLGGLLGKAVQFVSSREIPRNVDIYLYHQWSLMQRVLTWKVSGFGFPFGVLLPLAVLGVVYTWRRLPLPLLLFVVFYPLAVILVFISARYRVPILPALCILAAAGCLAVIQAIQAQRWPRLGVMAGVSAGVVLLSLFPGPFPAEEQDFEPELYFGAAYRQISIERHDEALPLLRQALRLDPDNVEGNANLGNLLLLAGKTDEAITHYIKVLELSRESDDVPKEMMVATHDSLARALSSQRQLDAAAAQYRAALRLAPNNARLHADLALSLMRLERTDEGIAEYRTALRIASDLVQAHMGLAIALQYVGRHDEAVAEYQEVLRREPGHAEARKRLNALLAGRRPRQP